LTRATANLEPTTRTEARGEEERAAAGEEDEEEEEEEELEEEELREGKAPRLRTWEICCGLAVVRTSQSLGRIRSRASRTAPPTMKEAWPLRVEVKGLRGKKKVRVGGGARAQRKKKTFRVRLAESNPVFFFRGVEKRQASSES